MSATQPSSLGPIGSGWTNVRQCTCRSWAYDLFRCKCPPRSHQALGLQAPARQMPAKPPAFRGHMTCFAANVRHTAIKPWAYWLRQDKCPPNHRTVLGIWLVPLQMSATQPSSLGPIGSGRTNVRQCTCLPWAYDLFRRKCPPPSHQTLGLLAPAGQMSATQPSSLGSISSGWTNVRQCTCRPWAYDLFRCKCPPLHLPSVGIWLVQLQMSATEPTSLGPIGCGRTKVRQVTCRSWAYDLFRCKCPPLSQQTLDLSAPAGQMSDKSPASLGHMPCQEFSSFRLRRLIPASARSPEQEASRIL